MEAAQSVMVKLHTETPFWGRAPYKSGLQFLSASPWTVESKKFSRPEYRSG